MTIKEHIDELVRQAKEDLGAVEALGKAGYYGHALFWAHWVLEKLCKALWMQSTDSNDYPYIHNLIKLLSKTDIELSDSQKTFFSDMNLFQAKSRYPDALRAIEITVTKEQYDNYFEHTKHEIEWLLKQLR